jgi:uncharacterized membrane protein
MNFIPEWAPGIHPLLVHFPIVLFAVALLFDLMSLLVRDGERFRFSAALLYGLGAVSAVVVFFTGRSAGDAVMLDGEASVALTDHADWALRTVWYLGLFVAARIALSFVKTGNWTQKGYWILLLAGAIAMGLVQQTAERGAKLVFLYGVGVQTAEVHVEAPVVEETGNGSAIQEGDAGGWVWTPVDSAPEWPLTALAGSPPASGAVPGTYVFSGAEPGIFVAPGISQNVQMDAELDVSDFDGTVELIHHVQDAGTYEFFRTGAGEVVQGFNKGGEMSVLDRVEASSTDGALVMRAVTDLTHRRGYLAGELVTHGHGDAPAEGKAGLRISGTGTIRILSLGVTPLRSPEAAEAAEPAAAAAPPAAEDDGHDDHSH